ncbi:uncharacterized protein BDV17DRAFT_287061 [Aspergillus undulatus]|uniref:uncharacterized protein n=1 Tax=Aspergillus undulatus TaxID=1810928 RepID=UPI003CCDA0BA
MTDQTEEALPSAKRRRVRKGTRSCWECKRRKIRCLFAAPGDITCIGCHHRRGPCVSQDMPENLAPATKGSRHLSDRIARIEDAFKDWLVAPQHEYSKITCVKASREILMRFIAHPQLQHLVVVLPARGYFLPSPRP